MLLSPWMDSTSSCQVVSAALAHCIKPVVSPVWSAGVATVSLMAGAVWPLSRRCRTLELRQARETRLRHELAAYVALEICPSETSQAEFARCVSRTVATRSSFPRAAMLLRNVEGALAVQGSAGMDDLSVAALNLWGATINRDAGAHAQYFSPGQRVGRSSFAMTMERRAGVRSDDFSKLSCARVHVVPMRTKEGLIGALVVCADARLERGLGSGGRLPKAETQRVQAMAGMMEPLEALATRIAGQLRPVLTERAVLKAARRSAAQSDHVTAPHRSGTRRRAMDVSDAPVTGSLAPISVRRLLEMTGAPAGLTARPMAGVSGFPPARLWTHDPVHVQAKYGA